MTVRERTQVGIVGAGLFLALLDTDRFEGRYRDGVHAMNTDGLMRRMVKEDLKTFDGKPLFPERHAYTAPLRPEEPSRICSRGDARSRLGGLGCGE